MLEYTKETVAPKVVVSDVNKTQAVATIKNKSLSDFTKALERMQCHKFLFASPTGSILDDKVRDALDTLAEGKHCTDSKMHMDIEGGVPPESIIPDDPKYQVSKPSSVDLTFYKQINGWLEHASLKQASRTRTSKRIAAQPQYLNNTYVL
ncbi:hypothetical protein AGABI1DRAFT_133331 [Agaricus bisporus var. burnettii JB137-S8]|uniref:Uncharacterized protein n=1 Tax=Agaricus bisporus var. burnettii (strain JB137-S8 / ATCC MYA-4627 / FGSC 10392) TaxID=597362 RepID=K5WUY7_AGABU|nr:uncharacterized protein AGABI1DRAFT_133331 [Agaricus bisporus var. burnettii JB137-S8]EKM74382.1 hypothetical protein AGABI1DRAFT_133331 [Agaricus bisporus var. burnettii JB137-S8]